MAKTKQSNETAFESLERIVDWLRYEHASVRDDLPTHQAVIEFAAVLDTCGCLSSGDVWDDPTLIDQDGRNAWNEFVDRWQLKDWKRFCDLSVIPLPADLPQLALPDRNAPCDTVPTLVAVSIAIVCGLVGLLVGATL